MKLPVVHLSVWPWLPLALVLAMGVLALIKRKQYVWTIDDTGRSILNSLAEPYWLRVVVAFDLFANVCGWGQSGLTISTRCWIWSMRPHGHLVQKFINRWLSTIQRDHGLEAATGDLGRAQRNIETIQAALADYARAHPPHT